MKKIALPIAVIALLTSSLAFAQNLCPERDEWTPSGGGGYVTTEETLAEGVPLKLFYRVLKTGKGAAKSPVYFLLPGGPGLSIRNHDFSGWLKLLPEEAIAVAVEPRGVGCSRPFGLVALSEETLGISKDASDIEAVRKHLFGEEKPINLIGYGYGGTLAISYSILYAEHTDKTVSLAPYSEEGFAESPAFLKGLMDEFLKENGELKTAYAKKMAAIKDPNRALKRQLLEDNFYALLLSDAPKEAFEAILSPEFEAYKSPLTELLDAEIQRDAFLPLFCQNIFPAALVQSASRGAFGFGELCAASKSLSPVERFSIVNRLSQTVKRTLVIAGERDFTFPPAAIQTLKENTSQYRIFTSVAPGRARDLFEGKNDCAAYLIKAFMEGASTDDLSRISEGSHCKK